MEPSIAINPTDPDNIIAASIRYGDMEKGENRVMNIRYHSKDGGKTWALHNEHNPNDRCQGDDAVVFYADGVAYHSVIAFRGLRTNKQKATGIYVFRSEKDTDKGTIYVNWVDERNGDPDVFIMSSKDKGTTWTNPVRVNDDPVGNGKAQFFSWMSVDPIDGSVNVVFYDRRDFEGTKTGLILARSIDGGRAFMNHPISQKPFECNKQVFLGDYTGIDAYNGRVATVYGHFTSMENTAISVAVFDFVQGTQRVE